MRWSMIESPSSTEAAEIGGTGAVKVERSNGMRVGNEKSVIPLLSSLVICGVAFYDK